MKRRIYLHAGTHKTGTTSLQIVLSRNAAWLRDRGFYYPRNMNGKLLAHHDFAHALSGEDAGAYRKALRYGRQLADECGGNEAIILSSEVLYRKVIYTSRSMSRWEKRVRYLDNVRAALEDFDVIPVLFFRNKEDFVKSLERERRRNGSFPGEEMFILQTKPLLNYERNTELFRNTFGSVLSVDYDLALEDGVIPTFFRLIGAPVPRESDVWVRKFDDDLEQVAAALSGK